MAATAVRACPQIAPQRGQPLLVKGTVAAQHILLLLLTVAATTAAAVDATHVR